MDLTDDVSRIASPRDPEVNDPYVWFDPVNVGTMAQTLGTAMGKASPTQFEAYQFYGLRAFSVQNEALRVDQRLQEQFNPCRIATLVVEAPVLTYFARAYAFDQVPLIAWEPEQRAGERRCTYTLDAAACGARGGRCAHGVTGGPGGHPDRIGAPRTTCCRGCSTSATRSPTHQDCPLVTPSSSDRPAG